MLRNIVVGLALVTIAALAVLLSGPAPEAAKESPVRDRGPAPFEGRATLDHQGQPMELLPSDEKVAVTR